MAKRLVQGIQVHTDTLATGMFEGINFKADFLKQKVTRKLFSKEQFLPSDVIDRGSIRTWQEKGRLDTFDRARLRTDQLLAGYQRPATYAEQDAELLAMMRSLARSAGLEKLPEIDIA
jgi:trimethylamine:corrinoid methyltransferase-like protein